MGRPRRDGGGRRPRADRSAAVPLLDAALDLRRLAPAAGRQRPPAPGLGRIRDRDRRALRAHRDLLGRARAGQRRTVAAAADPQLADLERGELLLLHAPRLAAALRAAARRLPAGDQPRRPARRPRPRRPLRRAAPGPAAGDGRGRVPRTALPRARRQGQLRRRRRAPLRRRRGGAAADRRRSAAGDGPQRRPPQRPLPDRGRLGLAGQQPDLSRSASGARPANCAPPTGTCWATAAA